MLNIGTRELVLVWNFPRLYGISRAVWNFLGCMEFPGLYGDLQTGFEPIKFLDNRSV